MSMFILLFLAKWASDFQKTRGIIGHPSPYIWCLGSYGLSGLEWIYCVVIYIYRSNPWYILRFVFPFEVSLIWLAGFWWWYLWHTPGKDLNFKATVLTMCIDVMVAREYHVFHGLKDPCEATEFIVSAGILEMSRSLLHSGILPQAALLPGRSIPPNSW